MTSTEDKKGATATEIIEENTAAPLLKNQANAHNNITKIQPENLPCCSTSAKKEKTKKEKEEREEDTCGRKTPEGGAAKRQGARHGRRSDAASTGWVARVVVTRAARAEAAYILTRSVLVR